jgi:hypothetical protein
MSATPAKAMAMPTPRRQPIRSLKKNAASRAANGTCSCTAMAAVEASICRMPVNIRLKCRIPRVIDRPISSRQRGGSLMKGTSISATTRNRSATKVKGGISPRPHFTTTKLNPQIIMTRRISNR